MSDTGKRMVVALGGNAMILPGQRGTISEQVANIRSSINDVVTLISEGWETVITHGNGPQVGDMLLMVEAARGRVPELPLGVCVADTEGAMGYMIQQALLNRFHQRGLRKGVVTIITQVMVDRNDPAFENPTKPVGPYMSAAEAEEFRTRRAWEFMEVSEEGFRRVVPSPQPLEIVERETIRRLLDAGEVVIAAGGGGIPVAEAEDGTLDGVDAVIDKDFAASVLARDVSAQYLAMLTGVPNVYLNFRKPRQTPLHRLTVEEAEGYLAEGQFPPGSMGPKMQAAVSFIKQGGKEALITSVDGLRAAILGQGGTRMTS